MGNTLRLTFQKMGEVFEDLSLLKAFELFCLHIFASWNGIQFLFYPIHFGYIVDTVSIVENYFEITRHQQIFIPVFIFCILTGLLMLLLFRCLLEIDLYCFLSKVTLSFRGYWDSLINYSVPSIINNLFIVLILATAYFLIGIVYFLLASCGVQIDLNPRWVFNFSAFYFVTGVVTFNLLTADFVIPYMLKSFTYTDSLNKFYSYFLQNKKRVLCFYIVKFICIVSSLLIFIYFLHFFLPEPFIRLPFSMDVITSFQNISVLFCAVVLSLIIYSVIILFFNILCSSLFFVLFADYLEKKRDILPLGNDSQTIVNPLAEEGVTEENF
ncbi:MAG: hypothetical protein FWG20_02970 [Candidatus Cloacimonetes bacterium]|nr:hypothetical protein [Candidatus Cloacimonadota bacterium]